MSCFQVWWGSSSPKLFQVAKRLALKAGVPLSEEERRCKNPLMHKSIFLNPLDLQRAGVPMYQVMCTSGFFRSWGK